MASQPERQQAKAEIPLTNLDAEEAVLGAILIDPAALALVRPILSDADFSSVYHASVYRAMLRLADAKTPVDIVTLSNEVTQRGGDAVRLVSLLTATPTAANVVHYAHIVSELGTRRRLMDSAAKIAALAMDEDRDIDEICGEAFSLVRGTEQSGRDDLAPVRDMVDRLYERVNYWQAHPGEITGLSTGLIGLDRILGGIDAEYIIIGGRPSHGKSTLMYQIALHWARNLHKGVAFYSLEVGGLPIVKRMACHMARLNTERVKLGRLDSEELARLYRAMAELAELPIYIDSSSVRTAGQIAASVARKRLTHPVDAVVVDYLQLLGTERRVENRVREIGQISRGLKNLSESEAIPVMTASQLSRAVVGRDNKIPQLTDLRDSGDIEQDADVVIFINRPEMYYRQDHEDAPEELRGMVQLDVAKRRDGAIGHPEPMRFFEEWGQIADAYVEAEP